MAELQNYAGSTQRYTKSRKNVHSIGQGDADTKSTRGLNVPAVKHTTVKVFELPLQQELSKEGEGLD